MKPYRLPFTLLRIQCCVLVLFVMSACFQSCRESPGAPIKDFYNKEFGWSVDIPEGFDSVPPAQWAKMQNKGANAIENTYDVDVENNARQIFVFNSDQFNYFEANWQPADSSGEDYAELFRSVNDMVYHSFEVQMPQAKLDSAYGQEKIDGLEFQTFSIGMKIGDMNMRLHMFSRLFGKKEFTVNIMTVDGEKEKRLLEAWRRSEFEGR
ncbi:MAG TPA: hypothetical protein VFR58_11450 [Flavisolibacter sp.]|nr:hypothetical protein [Flavisolibacter sp.]